MAGYYYNQLNKAEKAVYDTLKAGMNDLQPSIRIPRLENGQLLEVFTRLKLDEPLLFFVVSYTGRFYPEAQHMEFVPEYGTWLVLFGRKNRRKGVDSILSLPCMALAGGVFIYAAYQFLIASTI